VKKLYGGDGSRGPGGVHKSGVVCAAEGLGGATLLKVKYQILRTVCGKNMVGEEDNQENGNVEHQ